VFLEIPGTGFGGQICYLMEEFLHVSSHLSPFSASFALAEVCGVGRTLSSRRPWETPARIQQRVFRLAESSNVLNKMSPGTDTQVLAKNSLSDNRLNADNSSNQQGEGSIE
jgi:hypothetical protein